MSRCNWNVMERKKRGQTILVIKILNPISDRVVSVRQNREAGSNLTSFVSLLRWVGRWQLVDRMLNMQSLSSLSRPFPCVCWFPWLPWEKAHTPTCCWLQTAVASKDQGGLLVRIPGLTGSMWQREWARSCWHWCLPATAIVPLRKALSPLAA